MKDRVRFCVDPQKFSDRPPKGKGKGSPAPAIAKRIFNYEVEKSWEELADLIVEGHSVLPMITDGKGCEKDNWLYQRIFEVDFECKLPADIFKERLDFYHLPWKFFYSTFSHTGSDPRFRIIFDLGDAATSIEVADSIQFLLAKFLFPESDKQCSNCNRWYYGGKEILYPNFDSRSLTYTELEAAARNHQVAISGHSTKAKNRVSKDTIAELLQFEHTEADIELIRGVDFGELSDKLTILKSFKMGGFIRSTEEYNAGARLTYPELFGIATNLQCIEGGIVWMRQVMDATGTYESKHYAVLSSIKGRDYNPSRLENFSPFEEDWEYKNILQATYSNQYSEPVPVANYVRKAFQLKDAERKMKHEFLKACESNDTKVYVFNCATGLGKSTLLIDSFNDTHEPVAYAFPTHALKDELGKKIGIPSFDDLLAIEPIKRNSILFNLPVYVTPKLPDCIPEDIASELEYYYSVGLYQVAQNKIAALRKDTSNSPEVLNALDLYFQANSLTYGQNHKSVWTTHAKMFTKNQKDGKYPFGHCKTIICDEDILNVIIPSHYVIREDLYRLENLVDTEGSQQLKRDFLPVIKEYQTYINKRLKTVETIRVNLSDTLSELISLVAAAPSGHFSGNILDLFRMKGFYVNDDKFEGKMHYAHKKDIPTDRKIIILSATADEHIYRELFGDRLEFIDISNVVPVGNLVQDMSNSCSKSSLNVPNTINKVVDKAGDLPTITFKDFRHKFKNPADSYFGNCAGYDSLNGNSINVVGTPYPSPNQVFIIAAAMGLDYLTADHVNTTTLVINRNGYRFKLNTFEDPNLQAIQCALIESNLIQAIGRSRILRNDCTVYLYSGYPIPSYKETDVEIVYFGDNSEPNEL